MSKKAARPISTAKRPYTLPARPEALLSMVELMQRKEPNADQIAQILKQDVCLYASVLSEVNAPHLGLRKKITDLTHAITLLGLDRLFAIVRLAALKNSLGKVERLDRFWDSATEIAELSALLAKKLTDLDPHDAYSLGMMHDCGIPVMLEAFSDYKAFLRTGNGNKPLEIKRIEQQQFSANHFTIGGEMADKWYMPHEISQAIELQVDLIDVLSGKVECNDKTKTLICVLTLAKEVSAIYRRFWRIYDNKEPLMELPLVLAYLGLPDVDYLDLREDLLKELEKKDMIS
ncbi:MAG: hypothetical protein CMI12_10800 [Oceanospirillum sp.]|nr:hypothetical protein [Oceanospirillum sp.]